MPRVYPSIDGKSTNHALPPSLVEITAGFSAGIFSTLAVHPFDVVKTRLQVNQGSGAQVVGGSFKTARDILRNEGFWGGYYRGLSPNIIGNSVSWALYFMWYGNIKDMIQAYRGSAEHLHSIDYFAASGLAGIFTAGFTNPIWVIKTRMLSTSKRAPGAYVSIAHGTRNLYSKEGIRGFYRGLVPSLFGVSHGAIQFMAYEKFKIWRVNRLSGRAGDDDGPNYQNSSSTANSSTSLGAGLGSTLKGLQNTGEKVAPQKNVELSNWDFLSLSAVSKIFAGTATYPYQVLRARLQTYDAHAKYKGCMDVIRQIWAVEGIPGFYKGLGPNIVRVLPSTCVTFLVYENTKIYLPRFYDAERNHDDEDRPSPAKP
ncbi:MAG: hypothetical protein M1828_006372 [Chrysothrix sp. TS-e1954]|nr:MAG: hypothetical protein M1828_006372 [Chrysothrix sp. TS-e1954]